MYLAMLLVEAELVAKRDEDAYAGLCYNGWRISVWGILWIMGRVGLFDCRVLDLEMVEVLEGS